MELATTPHVPICWGEAEWQSYSTTSSAVLVVAPHAPGTEIHYANGDVKLKWYNSAREHAMEVSGGRVSGLLRRWSLGDPQAREELVPILYDELRRLAHYHLRGERDGHTLQTTALVHEVYLRLCAGEAPQWKDRAHFFAVAARIMRRILVDYSRRHAAEKRGGPLARAPLDDALTIPVPEQFDLVALDGGLEQLAAFDARKCQVVEMRFFTGLKAREIAAVLKTTEATVRRDWIIAKAWLYRYLEEQATP